MKSDTLYREDLAFIHHTGFGDFARAAAPGLLRLIKSAGIPGGTLVDLACGSGLWASIARRHGFTVIGVDHSAAMIRLAKGVAAGCRFYRASLHDFDLPRCDVVTIIGEGLNYLSSGQHSARSLHRFFARVAKALRPGGLFIFDVMVDEGKPMRYRTWREGRNWAVLVQVEETNRQRLVLRNIISFRKVRTKWRQARELHRIWLFARTEILRELRHASFSVCIAGAYGGFRLPPRRIAFIARKPVRRQ